MNRYCYDVSSRILEHSTKQSNGCIEYRVGKLKHVYGLISITINGKRKSVPAHRAMYIAMNDCFDLPRSIQIRHTCDNPRCVNIEHLERGTALDNMHDCIGRGRRATKYRLHTRQHTHSDETIRAIRAATGKCKWIAAEHGVSIGYVSKIRAMKAKTLVC